MGLFSRKRKESQSSAPQEEQQQGQQRRGAAAGDPRLPGLAGYPTGPLPKKKNHMPPQRFTYNRPDGRE
jgi:hypothetical protein